MIIVFLITGCSSFDLSDGFRSSKENSPARGSTDTAAPEHVHEPDSSNNSETGLYEMGDVHEVVLTLPEPDFEVAVGEQFDVTLTLLDAEGDLAEYRDSSMIARLHCSGERVVHLQPRGGSTFGAGQPNPQKTTVEVPEPCPEAQFRVFGSLYSDAVGYEAWTPSFRVVP